MTYEYRIGESGTWVDLGGIVDSRKTEIREYLCTTEFKSAVDEASFTIPSSSFTGKTALITAIMGDSDVYVRIKNDSTTLFTGTIDRSSTSVKSTGILGEITVSCRDLSTVHLDDTVSSHVFLENKTISYIVKYLLTLAGYSYSDDEISSSEERTLAAFVIDKDEADTYRSYIDTLLFEAGGYVVDFDATGTAKITRLPWDDLLTARSVDDYHLATGLTTSGKIIDVDGVKVTWSILGTKEDATVYQADISLSTSGSQTVGQQVYNGDYWPSDLEHDSSGNNAPTSPVYLEYNSSLLDTPYLTKDTRKQNEDLSIICVRNVTANIVAKKDGSDFTAWKYPVSGPSTDPDYDANIASIGLYTNPTLYPTKAWYCLKNASGSDNVYLNLFELVGDVTYRQKIVEYQSPSTSKKPQEYTSTYIYSVAHANHFVSFYWHFLKNSRFQATWAEINNGTLGESVAITHKGASTSQHAVVVSKKTTFLNENTKKVSMTAVGISSYSAYTVSKNTVSSGEKFKGEAGTSSTAVYLNEDSYNAPSIGELQLDGEDLTFNSEQTAIVDWHETVETAESNEYAWVKNTDGNGTVQIVRMTGNKGATGAQGPKGDTGAGVNVKADATSCTAIGDAYIVQDTTASNYGHLLILTSLDPRTFTDGGEIKGPSGTSIVWKGSSSTAPSNPSENWAYYNTIDKKSYVYDGSDWLVMTCDGTDAKVFLLSSPSTTFVSNRKKSTSQSVTINVDIQNISGTCTITAVGKTGSTSTSLTVATVTANEEYTVTIPYNNSYDSVVVTGTLTGATTQTLTLALLDETGSGENYGYLSSFPQPSSKGYAYFIAGDYFVAAANITESSVTYTQGKPYIYNGSSWEVMDIDSADNASKAMNLLELVVSNGMDISAEPYYGWFKNLVAQNAVIQNLFTKNITLSGAGVIQSDGYDPTDTTKQQFKITHDGEANFYKAHLNSVEIDGISTFNGGGEFSGKVKNDVFETFESITTPYSQSATSTYWKGDNLYTVLGENSECVDRHSIFIGDDMGTINSASIDAMLLGSALCGSVLIPSSGTVWTMRTTGKLYLNVYFGGISINGTAITTSGLKDVAVGDVITFTNGNGYVYTGQKQSWLFHSNSTDNWDLYCIEASNTYLQSAYQCVDVNSYNSSKGIYSSTEFTSAYTLYRTATSSDIPDMTSGATCPATGTVNLYHGDAVYQFTASSMTLLNATSISISGSNATLGNMTFNETVGDEVDFDFSVTASVNDKYVAVYGLRPKDDASVNIGESQHKFNYGYFNHCYGAVFN